jgi:V/A-type H+-transporting ATPase subunit E
MAIEDIFKALEEQADFEVNQILHAATVQSDAIEHEAREEAERITAGRIASAEEAVRAKSAKAVNAARLQVRRDMAAVRDRAVDDVFTEALKRLKALRGTAEYERIFTELAREALKGVESDCEVQVAPADAELAKKVIGGMGVTFTVAPTLDTVGGLVISTSNGRVVRRNTFESRLQKVRGLASAKIAEVMAS